ncbi:MAG: DUF3332 domain-containing protein [Bacteroidaceae bacterium]|nr:DUF3332 domain-containing protein [Bacteroidaceae bacterium]
MKKVCFSVATLMLAGSLLCTSCIGSFALFNKYEKWQCNMTDNKYVNAIVGFILQPIVGGICLFVDALVLNTIEFWSGDNPVAANNMPSKVMGTDGRYYAIKTTKKGYIVTSPEGLKTTFTHNDKDDSWSVTQNGVTRKLFRYGENGQIEAMMPSGRTITVTNDEAGVMQAQQAVWNDVSYAMR